MTRRNQIIISAVDYARLEPMIRDEVASRSTARELLCVLKAKIDQARVLEPCHMPGDVVTMNSLVRVRDLETEEVESYTLVYPAFADITKNLLSILTPVGTSLLGHRQGDTVVGMALLGPARLRVEQVEFQPESAGQFDV
jgi:regulator of nucleoside diphosphate kinase